MLTNFLKKQTKQFYIAVGVFVVTLISLLLYVSNSTGAYYNDLSNEVVIYSVLVLVLLVGYTATLNLKVPSLVLDGILVAAVVFLSLIITTTMGLRVESIAIIMFSDLESGNTVAQQALNQFFVLWILYLISLAAIIVLNFFKHQEN